ncbi:MAG: bifunctional adenosylcobinamide kinase/adenosylcobinamide-phosphate guanylyltransferase [Spirochaetales bacterium]|uniref:Adenosylcobinamide kinase n=1 Tax=Candidatus Thalassospirochaeta sargassi TaxID=3119039 RepID=A0AAJ1IID7_9SPIO|nr:bifunctional adenosylcobinamide kinase/adenosylcobinamide-phosphate guanylyltransferase [Spirochaetales bacterium]
MIAEKSGLTVLVFGGISSGKSEYAERLIQQLYSERDGRFYYFTPAAPPEDDEMRAKVKIHRERRPDWLETVECGLNPAEFIDSLSEGDVILFDSVGTLAGRMLMESESGENSGARIEDFLERAGKAGISLVLVSEEVGMTLVSVSEAGRFFQRIMGQLNQQIAASADEVFFINAGIPQKLK